LTAQQVDIEVGRNRDSKGLEGVFRTLWDHVRKATELIEHLKDENRTLQGNNVRLEEQIAAIRTDLMEKEEALRQVKQQNLQVLNHSDNLFSDEEKQVVKSKIKELITKIDSHL
jgi:peptidoglycan hydrolase CwlO-like protein